MPPSPLPADRSPESTWSWIAAILVALYFLVTSLYVASKRLFWFDEISTVLVARLPSLSTMWKALADGADLLPIPYFAIVRLSETVFGQGELGARVPSAVGLAIGLLVTFDCTRRLADGVHGFIAQALLTCSLLPFYGYEARPYGLLFMLSAMLLWVWLNGAGKLGVVVFGALMFAVTMIHFYGVLCLTPFVAWDAIRFRRPSVKLLAGFAGMGLAAALLMPQIRSGHRLGSQSAWPPPSIVRMEVAFSELFPTGLVLLGMIVLVVFLGWRKSEVAAPPSEGERVAWFFLLIPFAGFVLAILAGSVLYTRYWISALPGIAVACGCLGYRQLRGRRLISYGIAAILAGSGIAHSAAKARHPEQIQSFGDQQAKTRALIEQEDRFLQEGKAYTTVRQGNLVLFEAWYYSKHPERYVLLMPGPRDPVRVLARYYPFPPVWNLEDLRRHAGETALVVPNVESLQQVKNAGFRVSVRAADPLEVYYLGRE